MRLCNKQDNPLNLTRKQTAEFASSGNLTALWNPLTWSCGWKKHRAQNCRPSWWYADSLMNIIDTPVQTVKKSMSSSDKKDHIIKSVGLGNFSLNSSYENGLIDAVDLSRQDSLDFLKNSDTGFFFTDC